MITDFLKLIDLTKLPTRWWAAFAIAGLMLLFLPNDYAAIFGIAELRDTLRPYIGIFTLISITFLLVSGVAHVWKNHAARKRKSKLEATAVRHLETLSVEEAAILGACYYQDQRTITLPVVNAHANALVSKGIMRKTGGTGDFREWSFTVNEFIWYYLPPALERFPEGELQQVYLNLKDWQRMLRL